MLAAVISLLVAGAILGPLMLHPTSPDPVQPVPTALQTFIESGYHYDEEKDADRIHALLKYDSIFLQRGPCYGDCPIYSVTFHRNGHATLAETNLDDGSERHYTAEIQFYEYARLTQMVDLARKAAHEAEYTALWTDDYEARVRAVSGTDTWTVLDYGQVAPVEVWALETLLHDTKERQDWVPVAER